MVNKLTNEEVYLKPIVKEISSSNRPLTPFHKHNNNTPAE